MTLDEARAIFKKAETTSGLAAQEWLRLYDAEGKRRPQVGSRDEMTGAVHVIATVERGTAHDDEELLFNAPVYLRAAIAVARHAFDVIRKLREEIAGLEAEIDRLKAKKEKDRPAQHCGRACNDAAFLRWLAEVHHVDTADQVRVATRVRTMLGIQSRAELDTDPAAAIRWRGMWADFQAWRRGYGKAG